MSQRTIVNRISEERAAQARHDHLLKAARDDRAAYEARSRVAQPSLTRSVASAVRSALRSVRPIHGADGRPHGAAAR